MAVIHQNDPVILAVYGAILYDYVCQQGIDAETLLDGTDIREEVLLNSEAYLNYNQFVALVRNAIRLTGDPGLGLRYGGRLKFTTHGSMAQASLSAGTLKEAIELLVKYYKIRFAFIDMTFFIEGDEAVLQLTENLGLGELTRFLVESLFVAILDVNRFLFGDQLVRSGRCLLSYPAPEYVDRYEKIFSGSVQYDAGFNQLRFEKKYLDLPMVLASPVTRRLAEQECEAQLQHVSEQESILTRVKKILQSDPANIPTMEDVASAMFMTSRTLRRQLQVFDTTFQDLTSEIRKKRALELLRGTNMPVDEIAHHLGYSDPSNFGRAFRKWTGKSPREYRE